MKNKFYLIAIGYPIGGMEVNKNFQYNVECNGLLYSFELKNYAIWNLALCGMFSDKAKEIFVQTFNDGNAFDSKLKDFIESKLIIEIDVEDEENYFEKIQDLKPFRQGTGVGLKPDKNKYYIKTDKEIELFQVEFVTWIQCDGIKTIKQLGENYAKNFSKDKQQSNAELIQIILYLYKKGLIYLFR